MPTIWERVNTALSSLNIPVAEGAYQVVTGQSYPPLYLVHFLVSNPPEVWADGKAQEWSCRVQVNVWSRDGFLNLPDVDGAMQLAGFTMGPKRGLPFDPDTKHFGLSNEYVIWTEEPYGKSR